MLSKVVTEGFGANCFWNDTKPFCLNFDKQVQNSSKFLISGILVHCCNIFLLPYCFCCSTGRFQRCHRWSLSVLVRRSSRRRGKLKSTYLSMYIKLEYTYISLRFATSLPLLRTIKIHNWYSSGKNTVCCIFEFGYSEKATKLEKIFQLKFDVIE